MRKWMLIGVGYFAVAVLLFATASRPTQATETTLRVAQQKKDDPKSTTPSKSPSGQDKPGSAGSKPNPSPVSEGVVEVYQAKDGWRFRIKNAEGKSLAIGVVAYPSKEEALQAVQQVHRVLNFQKIVTLEPKENKK
ncbi:MAG: hypothetical protein NZ703_00255 [Gemmataceae bacterium]|nr:hypothetical protein [Gemmataceae bacterium]